MRRRDHLAAVRGRRRRASWPEELAQQAPEAHRQARLEETAQETAQETAVKASKRAERAPSQRVRPNLKDAGLLLGAGGPAHLHEEVGGSHLEGPAAQVDPQGLQVGHGDGAVADNERILCPTEPLVDVLQQGRHNAGVVPRGDEERLVGAGVHEEPHRRRVWLHDCHTTRYNPEAVLRAACPGAWVQGLHVDPRHRAGLVGGLRHLAQLQGGLLWPAGDQCEDGLHALLLQPLVYWLSARRRDALPAQATDAIPVAARR
mmetsp:Transcript_59250/g.185973  ORF Transcript_59250/g.185973 Transcript_59250/m.185973 type:complete len:260 (+) Transcript_59250:955-1734(+)